MISQNVKNYRRSENAGNADISRSLASQDEGKKRNTLGLISASAIFRTLGHVGGGSFESIQ